MNINCSCNRNQTPSNPDKEVKKMTLLFSFLTLLTLPITTQPFQLTPNKRSSHVTYRNNLVSTRLNYMLPDSNWNQLGHVEDEDFEWYILNCVATQVCI